MMTRSWRRYPSGALALAMVAALVVTLSVYALRASAQNPPTSTASASDSAAIQDILVRSYAARTAGLKSFDLSLYPNVFADDSAVPLPATYADYVSKVRARNASAASLVNGNGWLSLERSRAIDRHQSLDALANVQAKAKAQGREVADADIKSAQQADGSLPPPTIVDSGKPQKVTIQDLKINGNRATVNFDDTGAVYQATLIKTTNGWRIAGEQLVKVHA